MDKFLLAAVVTIATIAPASAQTNQVRYSQRSIVTPRTIIRQQQSEPGSAGSHETRPGSAHVELRSVSRRLAGGISRYSALLNLDPPEIREQQFSVMRVQVMLNSAAIARPLRVSEIYREPCRVDDGGTRI
jgi:hypothetical protein